MKSVSRWSVVSVALLALYLSVWRAKEPRFPLEHTVTMTTEENIKFYGYPYERHKVETEDGYLLNLIRIPRRNSNKLPVLIVHGFMASSNIWVAMGSEGSLAYQLHDAGYDVWLADLRGNRYSIEHNFLLRNDTKFWDFSFDEMGRFDVPALIDHVLQATGQQTLVHVGYSMGSASLFIMSAMRPEYNSKIETHFALAPAVFMKHSNTTFWRDFHHLMRLNQYFNEFPGSYSHGVMPMALVKVCNFNFLSRTFCKYLTHGVLGFSESAKNETVYLGVVYNGLSGSSVKTARHFLQLHESGGKFQRYDYGDKVLNMERYKQETPPQYDLSKTDIPVYVFYGSTDAVSPKQDMAILKNSVKGPVELIEVNEQYFNHGDFFMSNEAKLSLNLKILEKMQLVNARNNKRKGPASISGADSVHEVNIWENEITS